MTKDEANFRAELSKIMIESGVQLTMERPTSAAPNMIGAGALYINLGEWEAAHYVKLSQPNLIRQLVALFLADVAAKTGAPGEPLAEAEWIARNE